MLLFFLVLATKAPPSIMAAASHPGEHATGGEHEPPTERHAVRADGATEAAGTWLQRMQALLLPCCDHGADGAIPTDAFLEAVEQFPELYEAIFSVQMIVGILRKDVLNGVAEVRAAATAAGAAGRPLQGLVAHRIDAIGVEGIRTSDHSRGSAADGAKSLLWLNRAATFLARLMRGLADGVEPKAAASAAYTHALGPYHGFMTSKVVGTAMGLCPPRETILRKLDLPSEEEASAQLAAFLARLEPLVANVGALMASNGLDFPDKV